MIRGLLKLILILIIVVGVAAFFVGYRWGGPNTTTSPTTSTGTSGSAPVRERAREVGAEIGDKVAAGATAAEHALANGQITAKIKAKMALDDSDRKSTRLNSSHLGISYAVFCLKKKKRQKRENDRRKP